MVYPILDHCASFLGSSVNMTKDDRIGGLRLCSKHLLTSTYMHYALCTQLVYLNLLIKTDLFVGIIRISMWKSVMEAAYHTHAIDTLAPKYCMTYVSRCALTRYKYCGVRLWWRIIGIAAVYTHSTTIFIRSRSSIWGKPKFVTRWMDLSSPSMETKDQT